MTFFHGKCKSCGSDWTIGTVDGASNQCPECGANKAQWRSWSPIMDTQAETTKWKIVKFCCPCKASIQCIEEFALGSLETSGWKQIGKQWYCDDCAPYKRKAA